MSAWPLVSHRKGLIKTHIEFCLKITRYLFMEIDHNHIVSVQFGNFAFVYCTSKFFTSASSHENMKLTHTWITFNFESMSSVSRGIVRSRWHFSAMLSIDILIQPSNSLYREIKMQTWWNYVKLIFLNHPHKTVVQFT